MPGRFEFERAIRRSGLPPLSRLIALTLATWADQKTGVIPDRHQPSLTTLEAATGMSHGATLSHLDNLEAAGWVKRNRPSVEKARSDKARTKYRLRIPAGSARDLDEPDEMPDAAGSGDDLARSGDDPAPDVQKDGARSGDDPVLGQEMTQSLGQELTSRVPNQSHESQLHAGDDGIPGQLCVIEAAAEADNTKPPRATKKKAPPKPPKPNKHQVADDLAAAFWEHHKANCAQSFLAVRGVVRTAISNGRNRDDCARALDLLAREGRAISGGTLQTALAQITQPHRPQLKAVAGGLSQDQWDAAMDRARARDAAASSRETT